LLNIMAGPIPRNAAVEEGADRRRSAIVAEFTLMRALSREAGTCRTGGIEVEERFAATGRAMRHDTERVSQP
jgi:hypothetical protein